MIDLHIATDRLLITVFDENMSDDVHLNSLDEDNRRFVPDEVFETLGEAKEVVMLLMKNYGFRNIPLVYPIFLKNGKNIGYVQAVPCGGMWEIGYHISKAYTGNGYAAEAVGAFLPIIMEFLGIDKMLGICLEENIASQKVLEKCGFELFFCGKGDYQGIKRLIRKYSYKRNI